MNDFKNNCVYNIFKNSCSSYYGWLMLAFVFTIIFIPQEGEAIVLHRIFSGINGEKLWEDCDIPRQIAIYAVAFGSAFTMQAYVWLGSLFVPINFQQLIGLSIPIGW